jgi:adenylate cyclase
MGAALALYARLWLHLEDTYDVEPHTLTQELIARIRREQPQTLALPMDPTPQAASRAQPMLGPFAGGKPSIAVLPFRAGSLDVEHYLTSGIADSVVHALSALNELFVISRGSTLVYVDPSPDFYAIGRELGVRYIVHGSVQKAGQRLRVSTELVDTERSEVIYPNLRDGTISDFFDLQDQIAIDMVKFIAPEVRDRELRRSLRKRPQDITAYDLVLQSYEPLNSLEYAEFSRARDLLQRAMTLDPTYASAYAYAAWWHSYRIGQEWSPSFVEDSAIAERLSRKAIEINPKDALSLAIFGHQESYLRRDYASALRYFDQSLGLCPNLAIAWTLKGATLCFSGNFEEAVDCATAGVRLAPMDQSVFFAEHILAQAKHLCGHYEDALYWSEKSNARNKQLTSNLRLIIANMSALGRSQDAAEVAARHRDLAPNFTVGAWHSRTPLPGEAKVQWAKWLRSAGLAD